eukprot:SAG31_NODE_943_length_10852_cov_22.874454_8_plen_381_part_00
MRTTCETQQHVVHCCSIPLRCNRPGDYAVASPRVNGGTWNRGASKSGLEWSIYRAAQLPGPDYNTDRVHKYLEGRGGDGPRKGARILGREGYNLPFPFNQYYSGTAATVRGSPSEFHASTLTPWRRGAQQDTKSSRPEDQAESGGQATSDATAMSNTLAAPAAATAAVHRWRRARAMTDLLLAWADVDGDGNLCRTEFYNLQERCGRSVAGLTAERWAELCAAFGCTSDTGISGEALYQMYHRAALRAADSQVLNEDLHDLGAAGPWGGLAADFYAIHSDSGALARSISALPPPGPDPSDESDANSAPTADGNKPMQGAMPWAQLYQRGQARRIRSSRGRANRRIEPEAMEMLGTLPPRLQGAYMTMRAQVRGKSVSARE